MYKTGGVFVYRTCCERATRLYFLGGGGTTYPGSSVSTHNLRMLTLRVFTHWLDVNSNVFTISWYVPVYVHCIYSQSVSCRCSLSLFSLSNCIYVLFDTTILSESVNIGLSLQLVSSLLSPSSPSCLLWLFDAQHTSIVHEFWCPRQTQRLWFETSFRPEDPLLIICLGI